MRPSRLSIGILLIAVPLVLFLAALAAYLPWMPARQGPPRTTADAARALLRDFALTVNPRARVRQEQAIRQARARAVAQFEAEQAAKGQPKAEPSGTIP